MRMHEEYFIIVLGVALIFAIIWCYQFIQLMLLEDTLFPGRRDKILWVVAFIFMFFVAPVAFLFWKSAYLEVRRRDHELPARDRKDL